MFLYVARLEGFNFFVGVLKSPMSEIRNVKHKWIDMHPYIEIVSMRSVSPPYTDAVNNEVETMISMYGINCVRGALGQYNCPDTIPEIAPIPEIEYSLPWANANSDEDNFSEEEREVSVGEYFSSGSDEETE